MATLLDEKPEVEEEGQEVQSLEEVDTTVETPEAESDIPEKYQGKSAAELVRMVEESQRYIGKQGAEIGELRKTFDTYIKENLTKAPEPEEEIDFFEDPDRAVSRAIESHPRIKEAAAAAQKYEQASALSQLQARHPDMREILNDNSFKEWATATAMRSRLLQQADQQYDYEAADELFNLWKERKQLATQTVQVEEKARQQAVKQASTGTARGSASPSSRKIYRRADIIKLMKTDPERYESMSEEIFKAYSEGRVRT